MRNGNGNAVNDLLVWSAFYALVVGKRHHVTAPLASAPPDVQDTVIEEVVSAYERGEMRNGDPFSNTSSPTW